VEGIAVDPSKVQEVLD
jgi:hypothetical protein